MDQGGLIYQIYCIQHCSKFILNVYVFYLGMDFFVYVRRIPVIVSSFARLSA